MGAEVALGEGDTEGGVRGEIEGRIAFAPISENTVRTFTCRCEEQYTYFTTAMFTGAVVLARWISRSAMMEM